MKEEEYQKKANLLDQQATELNRQIEQLRELQVRSCKSVTKHEPYLYRSVSSSSHPSHSLRRGHLD